ncbi:Leucine Rich Repeat family protein [Trichomonas vaginalis G3]|uniref:Leucine Rich Repeat family protein n=1 Tax=Trichomonas vaginalis (strain ATCC PRA-98 / G3) TaxID=412133 RepID=A2EML5_TRIV3|nr:uncharacterized protein TVAGG3_0809880 [Trichomonas vaginalis G3]EAY06085.1 Leucine Rich Repeat family protein [Trichomonas vaginalis G3]KAI5497124.1 interleukin-8 biosynthetic process [Trichomonas vaginalis G3]|eukprot:XP_001318308.1 hypothetical protein [Trichomonas vaginalis G3]
MELFSKVLLNTPYLILDLSLNLLQEAGAISIAKYLEADPNLISLDLRSAGINIVGTKVIFTALQNNNHLCIINLSAIDGTNRNRLDTDGSRGLARCLYNNKILTEINVSLCSVTTEGAHMIGVSLTNNDSLTYLNLASNDLGAKGIEAMLKEGSFGSLETIILSKNLINCSISKLLCNRILSAPKLRHIDLSDNQLNEKFLTRLESIMNQGCKLESINLARNNIGHESLYALEMLIRSLTCLKKLILSGNPLKDEGIAQIKDYLIKNKSLVQIDFSNCGLRDAGAKTIAEIIIGNKTLEIINISSNVIGNEGGISIAKSLLANTTISEIYIRDNELKDDAAYEFVNSISHSMNIVTIDLAYNDFSYTALDSWNKCLNQHKIDIENRVPELAKGKIGELKQEEQHLSDLHSNIDMEEKNLNNIKVQLENMKVLYKETEEKYTEEIAKQTQLLHEKTQILEDLRNKSATRSNDFVSLKIKYEKEEQELHRNLSKEITQANQAVERQNSTELKYDKTRNEAFGKLSDARLKLSVAKDQLKQLIQEAHILQDKLEKEQEDAEDAEAQETQKVVAKITADQEEHPLNSILKSMEEQRLSRRSKKKLKKAKSKKFQ